MDQHSGQSSYRPRIAVVDFGAGNLRSVSHALQTVGAEAIVTDRADDIAGADGVVFPGDGAARSAMQGLAERNLIEPVREAVRSGRPFLGVCLGMQVLMTRSDEDGGVDCLGIIPGRVVRLRVEHKVPHMGWNQVRQTRPHRLYEGIPDLTDFYFVHSYVVVPDDPTDIIGETDYGDAFASIISQGNVVATQFHPEKSATAGIRMYRNFTRWVAETAAVGARAVVETI